VLRVFARKHRIRLGARSDENGFRRHFALSCVDPFAVIRTLLDPELQSLCMPVPVKLDSERPQPLGKGNALFNCLLYFLMVQRI
jgi:hypothetical protein